MIDTGLSASTFCCNGVSFTLTYTPLLLFVSLCEMSFLDTRKTSTGTTSCQWEIKSCRAVKNLCRNSLTTMHSTKNFWVNSWTLRSTASFVTHAARMTTKSHAIQVQTSYPHFSSSLQCATHAGMKCLFGSVPVSQ